MVVLVLRVQTVNSYVYAQRCIMEALLDMFRCLGAMLDIKDPELWGSDIDFVRLTYGQRL